MHRYGSAGHHHPPPAAPATAIAAQAPAQGVTVVVVVQVTWQDGVEVVAVCCGDVERWCGDGGCLWLLRHDRGMKRVWQGYGHIFKMLLLTT